MTRLFFTFLAFFAFNSDLFSQITWMQTNGINSERVQALAIDTSGNIYAGTNASGVFITSDKGASWTKIDSGMQYKNTRTLFVDTAGYLFAGSFGGKVYRSPISPVIWTQMSSGLTASDVRSLAMDSLGNLIAGSYAEGIFRSVDKGVSWTQTYTGLTSGTGLSLVVDLSQNIYVGGFSGKVHRSSDHGLSWTPVNISGAFADVASLAIHSDSTLLAGTLGSGFFRTTDMGSSWTEIGGGFLNSGVRGIAHNRVGDILVAAGDGFYLSGDLGQNWTYYNDGLTVLLLLSILVDHDGYVYAGTYGGGVFRTVTPLTDINKEDSPPSEFSLSQNYPNPFNPETVISYQLSVRSRVTLGIFDILGREVGKPVDEEQEAGKYKVNFNGGKLTSGVYICRIIAGDFVKTIKMSLVK